MQSRTFLAGVIALALGVLMPVASDAQSQAVGFSAGYFVPKGEDGRIENDVLLANLDQLIFDVKDFNGGFVGGEYLIGIGDFVEAGAGIGYYRRTVPTIYADLVNVDGSELEQDLRLRIIPISLTARLLPLGRSAAVQPYVGGGIGIFNWRYSETGEFVDFSGFIFRDRFIADGTNYGPIAVAGLRVPVGSVAVGGELRYQRATGFVGTENGFLADDIDLGGYTFAFTVHALF